MVLAKAIQFRAMSPMSNQEVPNRVDSAGDAQASLHEKSW
jgi:hypothetical protein